MNHHFFPFNLTSFLVLFSIFLQNFTESAVKKRSNTIFISNQFIKNPLKNVQCSLNGIHILEINPANNVKNNAVVNEEPPTGLESLKISFKTSRPRLTSNDDAELYESSMIESYTDSDQLSLRIEVTTLRSKYLQVSLQFYDTDTKITEAEAKIRTDKLIDPEFEFLTDWILLTKNQNSNNVLQISNGDLFLNRQRLKLKFKIDQLTSHEVENEDFIEDLLAERPVEWEDFLNDPEINFMPHWQAPLILTTTAEPVVIQGPKLKSSKEVELQLKSLLEGIQAEYLAFDEEAFEAVEYSSLSNLKDNQDSSAQITAIASLALSKEHFLFVASISAFLSYLLMMVFLSKMTSIKPKRMMTSTSRTNEEILQIDTQSQILTQAHTQSQSQSQSQSQINLLSNTQSRLPLPLRKSSQLTRSKPSIPSALHLEIHTMTSSSPSLITASPAGNVLHLQIPSISTNTVTSAAAPSKTKTAASFSLSDNRHLLFPSKLGNFPK